MIAGLTPCIGTPDTIDSADWPRWSGPSYNLATTAGGALNRPNLGLELLWQRPFGPAYSAISVVGDRLVTAYSDGESDWFVALEVATGEELWRFRLGDTYRGHDGSEDGPVATPTIHDGIVYCLGPRGLLVALRLEDGSKVWSRRLVQELHAKEPLWGFNSSPTVIGGVLVLGTGGPDGHAVTALDPSTGPARCCGRRSTRSTREATSATSTPYRYRTAACCLPPGPRRACCR
jgi:outer membrane protein assembly factor BamB